MTDNVYAAPSANFDERLDSDAEDRFYVVSTRKMLILFFATFGLYQLHWNFQNWQLHKRATGESVWPLPRAIFAIFFTHSLYREIAAYDSTGGRRNWDSDVHASGMVFLLFIGYVLSWVGTNSTFLDVASILLLIPAGLLLKSVQVEVNIRSGDYADVELDGFGTAEALHFAFLQDAK